jgi:hypothetical protein
MKQRMFTAVVATLSITASLSADLIVDHAPTVESGNAKATVVPVTSNGFVPAPLSSNDGPIVIETIAANQRDTYASSDSTRTPDNQSFSNGLPTVSQEPTQLAMMFEVPEEQFNVDSFLADQSMTPQLLPEPNPRVTIAKRTAEPVPANLSSRDITTLLNSAILAIPETGSLAVLGIISMGLMLRRQRR